MLLNNTNIKWQNTDNHEMCNHNFDETEPAYGNWMEFVLWLTNSCPKTSEIWVNDIPIWNHIDGWIDIFALIKIQTHHSMNQTSSLYRQDLEFRPIMWEEDIHSPPPWGDNFVIR